MALSAGLHTTPRRQLSRVPAAPSGGMTPAPRTPTLTLPPVTLRFVSALDPQPGTPSLDQWIAEVGDEEVAATIRASIQDIESGTTPGFTDKDSFWPTFGALVTGR